jgi:hypothetical protein
MNHKLYAIDLIAIFLFLLIGVLAKFGLIHTYMVITINLLIVLYYFPVKGQVIHLIYKQKEETVNAVSSLILAGVVLCCLVLPVNQESMINNPIIGLSMIIHLTLFVLNMLKIGQYVVEMNKRSWLHIIATLVMLLSYQL